MRIVLDLQGAQTGSRFRGIGRYTLSLAKEIAKNRKEHEIILVLNAAFPDTIDEISTAFKGLLPQENIRVWRSPFPANESNPENTWRREAGELIREAFILSLKPDIVHLFSMFEGYDDNALTSIGKFTDSIITTVSFYDFIPLLNPEMYLKINPVYEKYYIGKIKHLKKANGFLTISKSSAKELAENLEVDSEYISVVYCACDRLFRKISINPEQEKFLREKYKLIKPFIMYSGAGDRHKNLLTLIRAYAGLPDNLRSSHQLLFVGNMPEGFISFYKNYALKYGIGTDDFIIIGYVSDEDLISFYNLCKLFVFPSYHEGFGMPPLEAMACGAPVIGSNKTSIPEVIGRQDALFDPFDLESIKQKITQVLTDKKFREDLSNYGLLQAKKFSWDESGRKAIEFFEKFQSPPDKSNILKKDLPVLLETEIFKKNKTRILLIKLDHMGDFIIAIPAIMKLRAKYPYSQIDITVGSWNEETAKKLNIFTNIYILDYFKKESGQTPSAEDTAVRKLLGKMCNYDIAIDLRRYGDTRFLILNLNAGLKIAYQTHIKDIDNKIDILIPSEPELVGKITSENKVNMAEQTLKIIDFLPSDLNDYIKLPEFIPPKKNKKINIAIFPYAGTETREWGINNFKKLLEILKSNNVINKINLYFPSQSHFEPFTAYVNERIQEHISLSFNDLLKSLSLNSAAVSNNSLGAHISSYLNIPVIGIYAGIVSPYQWAPAFGKNYAIFNKVPCAPCYIIKKEQCLYDYMCLKNITPELVSKIVMNIANDKPVELLKNLVSYEKYEDIGKLSFHEDNIEIIEQLTNSIKSLKNLPKDENTLLSLAQIINLNFPKN